MDKFINYKNELKRYITTQRYEHCVSTANFMKKNAKYFKLNKYDAYTAGLLHDIAKEIPDRKKIKLAIIFKRREIFRIKYFGFKIKRPPLLHGIASAEIMYSELNIKKVELLESACCHTLGGENLSTLAKYTFVSDFCEPLRTHIHAKIINEMITKEKNLNKAYFYTYTALINNLLKKEKLICPESIEGYNEALKFYKG